MATLLPSELANVARATSGRTDPRRLDLADIANRARAEAARTDPRRIDTAKKGVFSLDRFRATVLNESLARTNRFEVLIIPPKILRPFMGELASLYCESASLPMLNINTKSHKIFGPAYQRPMTSDYGGEGMSFVFHVDRDMVVRKFFEEWMHTIVDPNNFGVSYQEDYITSVIIRQLDEQENVTHEIELLEAFPKNMNLMDLNNSSSNQTHRLNILFAFRYWKDVERSTTNATAIPRQFVNPEVLTDDQANFARNQYATKDPRRIDN